MLYEITLYNYRGSHHAILKDVVITEGLIHATQVGEVNGLDDNLKTIFTECTPRDYYAVGTFVLVEFKGELKRK